jgi:hypothetical protein
MDTFLIKPTINIDYDLLNQAISGLVLEDDTVDPNFHFNNHAQRELGWPKASKSNDVTVLDDVRRAIKLRPEIKLTHVVLFHFKPLEAVTPHLDTTPMPWALCIPIKSSDNLTIRWHEIIERDSYEMSNIPFYGRNKDNKLPILSAEEASRTTKIVEEKVLSYPGILRSDVWHSATNTSDSEKVYLLRIGIPDDLSVDNSEIFY